MSTKRNNIIVNDIKILNEREWKVKNKKYLLELEKFLDIADSIADEELKREVIMQMLKCDEALTKAAEEFLYNNK